METQVMDAVQQNGEQTEAMSTEVRVGRRKFAKEYKQRILAEAEACKHGELGLLLRREGLYSSTLDSWRRKHKKSGESALEAQKRGRKPTPGSSLKKENERLQRELNRTLERLRQAELIVDVQKKLCMMLGLTPAAEAP